MQYPTIGQPQYGFAPTMPGMAGGGLAALPVKRFQRGGLSDTPVGGLFSPVAQVGPVSVTPANVIGMVAPPVVSVPLGILGAYNSFMAKQDPAPIMEAKTAAEVEAQQAQMDADIAAAQDAEDAAQGLAMMNQMQTQQEQEVSPVDVAMDVASVAEAVGVDSVDAAEGAAAAAAAGSNSATDGSGGAGGDSGAGVGGDGDGGGGGPGDAGPGSDGSSTGGADSSDAGGAGAAFQYGGRVMRYEQGGLAAAQQTQSKGRGQDTMLVHMTPGEVKGLQALAMAHGGSLTINPETGLPEAGFLQRLLPAILGAGLTIASGGALTPLMAAGIVGGGYGVAKGSLKEGLMAGLGAYGGAGLTGGLTAAGATTAEGLAATEAAKQATGQALADEAARNAFLETGVVTSEAAKQAVGQSITDQATRNAFLEAGVSNTLPPVSTYAATATPAQIAAQQGFSGNLAMAARGPQALLTEQGRTAFMGPQGLGAAPYSGTASVMTAARALTPEPEPLKPSISNIRPYSLNIANPSGTPQYTPQDTREREQVRYTFSPQPIYQAAQGGTVDPDYNMEVDRNGGFSDAYKEGGLSALAKRRKALAGDKYYKFAQDRKDSSMEAAVEQNFAKGGMKGALPPRFLQGDGDGMSDSIKARIGGVQEARLADGEFVVPADVVSHLGNGSSKAGAKKLYSMMDKIRKARTGRTRQAPEVNPNKYMPA